MRYAKTLLLAAVCFLMPCALLSAEDMSGTVRKMVEKCTLDQVGTKPFHLKATFAPDRNPEKEPDKQGEIEYWWVSPTQWRREIRSPRFHQTLIVDGGSQWQKNDASYFPEWFNNLAVVLVRPVPLSPEDLTAHVKSAEVRHIG